jgi:hypothetical protein
MKRSPIARKTPMKRSTKPMARGLTGMLSVASRQLSKKPAKRMAAKRKARPAAETAHFKRVALLPCARCSIEGYSQAAHSNRYQDGKGAGIKAHYLATFPLCCTRPGVVGCHVEHDQCIGMTRDEADARTEIYIADTQRKLGIQL